MTIIRLNIGNDFQVILDEYKKQYPLLSYPEIIKMIVSRHYIALHGRQKWENSLSTMEISEDQAKSIAEARESEDAKITLDEFLNR